MNTNDLLKASQVLTWICDRMADFPEHRSESVQAQAFCHLANSVVVELAKHLKDGEEPYEALRLAVIGGMKFDGLNREELAKLLLDK